MTSGFEWFVAWRHLREEPQRRSYRVAAVGLVMLVVGVGWGVLARVVPHGLHALGRPPAPFGPVVDLAATLMDRMRLVGAAVGGLGFVVTLVGMLLANFTLFTAISIFGVFLGTGAPIIALSVMSGFETDLKSKIRATKADIVISRADDRPFSDWRAVDDKIASVPGVTAAMAYVESEVIVKHSSNPAGMGIILRGIDSTRATRVLNLERTLSEGKVDYLQHPERIPDENADLLGPIDDKESGASPSKVGAPEPARAVPGILLGDELYARTLHVFIGSQVDVACPMCGVGPTGPMPKLKPFRVGGHFYTGMYEFDSKLAYVSLAEAQRFLGMQGEVTGIEVRTADPDRAREIGDEIAARIGPGYEVRSWEELNSGLFMALKLEKIAMFIVMTFIALVASFSIVSNLIMLVTEKGREVAILKSMGAHDRAIMRVFFAEGLYIGLMGLGLGLVFGITNCLLIARFGLPLDPDVYYIQKLPVVMRFGEITSVSLAAVGLCCLATIYPAYLSARMRPVEGLRYE